MNSLREIFCPPFLFILEKLTEYRFCNEHQRLHFSLLSYTIVKCTYTVSIGGRLIRKLFKTGNSIVLSLPKEMLDDLGVKVGECINLELDRDQRRVILTPIEKPIAIEGVNEDFARQVDAFIQQYRPALEELAK